MLFMHAILYNNSHTFVLSWWAVFYFIFFDSQNQSRFEM